MHSHIPTVLSAVLTGEPYQPKGVDRALRQQDGRARQLQLVG